MGEAEKIFSGYRLSSSYELKTPRDNIETGNKNWKVGDYIFYPVHDEKLKSNKNIFYCGLIAVIIKKTKNYYIARVLNI